MCLAIDKQCQFCGIEIIQSGKGRAKDFCSLNCQETNKFLSAHETKMLKVESMSADAKKQYRSRMFSITNNVNSK